jgi:hypothetical protein
MVALNHIFGADMALALERDTYDLYCSTCHAHVAVRKEKMRLYGNIYCTWCKRTLESHRG